MNRIKNRTLFETKMAKIGTHFMTKPAKKHHPLVRTYIYSPYKGLTGGLIVLVTSRNAVRWKTKTTSKLFN